MPIPMGTEATTRAMRIAAGSDSGWEDLRTAMLLSLDVG